jgi:nudix-type nucleoside diphosphatase (YffH/AdpP family)
VLCEAWYTLRRATFEFRQPDGSWHREHREAYDRGNGVVALLHEPHGDTVLLVRQYRAPAHLNGHPDGMLLEAPAGLLDAGEGSLEAISRELEEEVGHRVSDLRLLWTLYMSPGSVTEHVTYFAGTYGAATRSGAGGGAEHEREHIDLVEVTLDEALAMIGDGRIVDAKTVILLQHLSASRAAGGLSRAG